MDFIMPGLGCEDVIFLLFDNAVMLCVQSLKTVFIRNKHTFISGYGITVNCLSSQ